MNFVGQGTLGDLFIIICKLYHVHEEFNKSIDLTMYSLQPIMESPMMELADLIPWLNFRFIYGQAPFKFSGNFINIYANGVDPDGYTDADYIKMEAYPRLFGSPIKDTNIGAIQLFAGRWTGHDVGNFRGFGTKFVEDLARWMAEQSQIPVGFAVETPMINLAEYATVLEKHGGGLRILSGISEGVRLMREALYLFSPIGFYTFMILSMGKYANTFYTHDSNIVRLNPHWLEHCGLFKRDVYRNPKDGPFGVFKHIELEEMT